MLVNANVKAASYDIRSQPGLDENVLQQVPCEHSTPDISSPTSRVWCFTRAALHTSQALHRCRCSQTKLPCIQELPASVRIPRQDNRHKASAFMDRAFAFAVLHSTQPR